jgi:hypothetical protein
LLGGVQIRGDSRADPCHVAQTLLAKTLSADSRGVRNCTTEAGAAGRHCRRVNAATAKGRFTNVVVNDEGCFWQEKSMIGSFGADGAGPGEKGRS